MGVVCGCVEGCCKRQQHRSLAMQAVLAGQPPHHAHLVAWPFIPLCTSLQRGQLHSCMQVCVVGMWVWMAQQQPCVDCELHCVYTSSFIDACLHALDVWCRHSRCLPFFPVSSESRSGTGSCAQILVGCGMGWGGGRSCSVAPSCTLHPEGVGKVFVGFGCFMAWGWQVVLCSAGLATSW